jgi:hypothetical protein
VQERDAALVEDAENSSQPVRSSRVPSFPPGSSKSIRNTPPSPPVRTTAGCPLCLSTHLRIVS